jgi:hypothetical protein
MENYSDNNSMNTEEILLEDWPLWNDDTLMELIEKEFNFLKSRIGKRYLVRFQNIMVIDLIYPSPDEAAYLCRLDDEPEDNASWAFWKLTIV